MSDIKSTDIEIAVAHWFGIQTHITVPNLSWAMMSYECDLAILPFRGDYLYEVEIKVSRSDLLRDRLKYKWHNYDGGKIRKLWFAIPEGMGEVLEYIPKRAGLLVISEPPRHGVVCRVEEVKKPIIDKQARKLTDKEKFTLARLGAMRIWSLKLALKAKAAQMILPLDMTQP